ncbi:MULTISPECIES: Cthe_2314 family HEPN domain-containing protein [Paenibacillus]|uniref:Cthe-2314-like HEPN domain-containing protein n=1 Tax=Paenibacillus pabuli TaxID=1472 RepID=A0A855XY71_9BACL|nr:MULTISPECIES: Cthe_2314 family HEPN domain-containing protein [Paenibacillus]PWW31602.1 hypothetical protein DET56_1291 [Paenibacillus pabuli]PXW11852.1 hypothetical protein DEU73_101723 [Paenibacillus taichungensis]
MDIYDYAKLLPKEDWQKICGDITNVIDKINLNFTKNKFDIFSIKEGFYQLDLSYWITEFNNRVFDLITNYSLMKMYYDAGIPDQQWHKSPGDNGESIQYFPHFTEEHYGNLYWFSFYMESYYTRFEGIIDSIFHALNIKYMFNIEPKLGFRRKVLKKLKQADLVLHDYFISLPDNQIYRRVNEFRNSIIHNYRPNQISSGSQRIKNDDGSILYKRSEIGKYTTSREFLININESLELLAEITDQVRMVLEESN